MIIGLNIGSNVNEKNRRGWINPETLEFQFIPIEEDHELERDELTFHDIGLGDLAYPNLAVHLDPEFETLTYGHIRRGFGDNKMWEMNNGDILFFYSTLDLLPERSRWGMFIVGYFIVEFVIDTRKMDDDEVKALANFQNNAHLKRMSPGVDLLVKGKKGSRLFTNAIQMSHPEDNRRLAPGLDEFLTTTSGKAIKPSSGIHRWVYYSGSLKFKETLMRNP